MLILKLKKLSQTLSNFYSLINLYATSLVNSILVRLHKNLPSFAVLHGPRFIDA